MNVFEKLLQVQTQLRAPKSQYNKFGSYYYRNCEDIQEAVKPLLQEVKATLVIGDELLEISQRFYIKATARFIDCESGEEIHNVAYAREELEKKGMDVSQVTGSTSSYARKYALNGLFCIDDVKDADHLEPSGKETRKQSEKGNVRKPAAKTPEPAPRVTKTMIETVKAQVEKYSHKGLKMEKLLSRYKINDITEMTVSQFQDCMDKMELYDKEETNE